MGKFLHKFDVNGYAPFGFLNLLLGGLAMLSVYILLDGHILEVSSSTLIGFSAVCTVIIFLRNLRCKNIFKCIFFTILALLFGAILAFIILFFGGWGGSANRTTTNENDSDSSQWKENFNMKNGTYYTDGHGNYKDQYGNDVYNPQGNNPYES